jgi:hypothetical protein
LVDDIDSAPAACLPRPVSGTRNVVLNPPWAFTDVAGSPEPEPSHTSWILALVGKLSPTIVTDEPGAPMAGVIDTVGPAATMELNGNTAAVTANAIVVIVTIRSRQSVWFRDLDVGVS